MAAIDTNMWISRHTSQRPTVAEMPDDVEFHTSEAIISTLDTNHLLKFEIENLSQDVVEIRLPQQLLELTIKHRDFGNMDTEIIPVDDNTSGVIISGGKSVTIRYALRMRQPFQGKVYFPDLTYELDMRSFKQLNPRVLDKISISHSTINLAAGLSISAEGVVSGVPRETDWVMIGATFFGFGLFILWCNI